MMNWLQIVQTACLELGLPQPAAISTTTDPQTLQIASLANREGRELLKSHEWTSLQAQFITNVIKPVSTTGNITVNSPIITNIPDTSAITAGTFVVTGNSIPVSARVVSVVPNQVTMDMLATGTVTATPLVFAQDTYQTPTDYDRFIDSTQWDRTNRWPLLGPSSPQEDQWHRSGVVTIGPRRHYRKIGLTPNTYRLWPPPGTGDTPMEFVSEYISNAWVIAASGARQSAFIADSDMPIFEDHAIILGCKWRYFQIKGFDYGPLQAEYIDYVDRMKAQDAPRGILGLAKRRFSPLITPANVQDGFFPGATGPNSS